MKELSMYKQLVYLPYMTSYKQLVCGAVELDVFSQLTEPTTAATLAERNGWNAANTENLLKGLYSIGYIKRDGDLFCNTDDANKYLVRTSPDYMGAVLQFFGDNQGMTLPNLVKEVKEGPQPNEQVEQSMDFAAYGQMMRVAQMGIRQTELVELVRSLPENDKIERILDLGCGAGLLGLAVMKDKEGRSGVLYDQPPMQGLIEETIAQQGMTEQASAMTGDFLKDDIGSGYDLIICSSVMLFAAMGGPAFFGKLKDALNPGGVVLCLNEGIEADYSDPWEMVVGYMTYQMQGMPMGMIKGQVKQLAGAGGFTNVENRTELLSTGTHDVNILRV